MTADTDGAHQYIVKLNKRWLVVLYFVAIILGAPTAAFATVMYYTLLMHIITAMVGERAAVLVASLSTGVTFIVLMISCLHRGLEGHWPFFEE